MSQLQGEAEENGFGEFRRKVRAAEVLSAAVDDDSVTEDSLARTLLLHLGLPEPARQSRAQEGREFTTSDPLK
jgi:hypothetical protein